MRSVPGPCVRALFYGATMFMTQYQTKVKSNDITNFFVFGMSHNILRKRNRWKEESAPKAWCLKSVWAELFYQIFLAASYFRLWGGSLSISRKMFRRRDFLLILFWSLPWACRRGGQKKSMLSLQSWTATADKLMLPAAGWCSKYYIKSRQGIVFVIAPRQKFFYLW